MLLRVSVWRCKPTVYHYYWLEPLHIDRSPANKHSLKSPGILFDELNLRCDWAAGNVAGSLTAPSHEGWIPTVMLSWQRQTGIPQRLQNMCNMFRREEGRQRERYKNNKLLKDGVSLNSNTCCGEDTWSPPLTLTLLSCLTVSHPQALRVFFPPWG